MQKKKYRFMVRAYVRPIGSEVYQCHVLNLVAFSHIDLWHSMDCWFREVVWSVPMEGYFVTEGNDIRTYFASQSFD